MKKRDEVPFNLSFLDVMCCGLGAVILLVLILSGRVQQKREDTTKDLQAELVRVTALYDTARADSRPKDARRTHIRTSPRDKLQTRRPIAHVKLRLALPNRKPISQLRTRRQM